MATPHLPLLPALQHLACREEGEVPKLAVHGLAGDAVPGPQTSSHPDPRKPGKCAHLLLPVTLGLAMPAQRRRCMGWPPVRGDETHVLLCFKWHHLMILLKKLVDFQTSWTQTSLNMASGLCFYGPEKEQMELCGKFSGRSIFLLSFLLILITTN